MDYRHDTIAAIATAQGNGAIGIIRLSGPESLSILKTVWKGKGLPKISSGQSSLGFFIDPFSQTILDQVLILIFRNPHSYTGEDVVEIHAHGGSLLLNHILTVLLRCGARPAEPGEFTKRAFLNGKMDLLQAESVADIISASSEAFAQMSEKYLRGELSNTITKIRNEMKVLRAQMEAMIDFPEDEDVQGLYYEEIDERINRVVIKIKELLSTYEEGRRMREGLRVAIIGKPNVGKSSLFNALLQENRAIVHEAPGTTRDLIEECLVLNGLTVRFIDTAGIRDIPESVESEGIRRAEEKLSIADLILLVLDSSRPLDKEDAKVFSLVHKAGVETKTSIFLILNKVDLPSQLNLDKDLFPSLKTIKISAQRGDGVEHLKQSISQHFQKNSGLNAGDGLVITHLRHRIALERALSILSHLTESSKNKLSLEFLVSDLTILSDHLGELTGEITNEEILGEIFSNFCIGK